jgi:hypothetical protein
MMGLIVIEVALVRDEIATVWVYAVQQSIGDFLVIPSNERTPNHSADSART